MLNNFHQQNLLLKMFSCIQYRLHDCTRILLNPFCSISIKDNFKFANFRTNNFASLFIKFINSCLICYFIFFIETFRISHMLVKLTFIIRSNQFFFIIFKWNPKNLKISTFHFINFMLVHQKFINLITIQINY